VPKTNNLSVPELRYIDTTNDDSDVAVANQVSNADAYAGGGGGGSADKAGGKQLPVAMPADDWKIQIFNEFRGLLEQLNIQRQYINDDDFPSLVSIATFVNNSDGNLSMADIGQAIAWLQSAQRVVAKTKGQLRALFQNCLQAIEAQTCKDFTLFFPAAVIVNKTGGSAAQKSRYSTKQSKQKLSQYVNSRCNDLNKLLVVFQWVQDNHNDPKDVKHFRVTFKKQVIDWLYNYTQAKKTDEGKRVFARILLSKLEQNMGDIDFKQIYRAATSLKNGTEDGPGGRLGSVVCAICRVLDNDVKSKGDLRGLYGERLQITTYSQGEHDQAGQIFSEDIDTHVASLKQLLDLWDAFDGVRCFRGTLTTAQADSITENHRKLALFIDDFIRQSGYLPMHLHHLANQALENGTSFLRCYHLVLGGEPNLKDPLNRHITDRVFEYLKKYDKQTLDKLRTANKRRNLHSRLGKDLFAFIHKVHRADVPIVSCVVQSWVNKQPSGMPVPASTRSVAKEQQSATAPTYRVADEAAVTTVDAVRVPPSSESDDLSSHPFLCMGRPSETTRVQVSASTVSLFVRDSAEAGSSSVEALVSAQPTVTKAASELINTDHDVQETIDNVERFLKENEGKTFHASREQESSDTNEAAASGSAAPTRMLVLS
jgi:hypothetical protein